jgi:hypothetical protein
LFWFCFVFKVALSPFYRLVNAFEFILVAGKDPTHSVKWKKMSFWFQATELNQTCK